MTLSNDKVGQKLKKLLIANLGVKGTILICAVITFVLFHELHNSFLAILGVVLFMELILSIVTGITYLVWIYRVHEDLNNTLTSHYPITSGWALARILIPVYNLYGLWNVFSTMISYFKEKAETKMIAKKLVMLLPLYYVMHVGSIIIDQFVGTVDDPVFYFSYVFDIALFIVYLFMTKRILQALQSANAG